MVPWHFVACHLVALTFHNLTNLSSGYCCCLFQLVTVPCDRLAFLKSTVEHCSILLIDLGIKHHKFLALETIDIKINFVLTHWCRSHIWRIWLNRNLVIFKWTYWPPSAILKKITKWPCYQISELPIDRATNWRAT